MAKMDVTISTSLGLSKILAARPAGVHIPTVDEDFGLSLLRDYSMQSSCNLRLWTVIDGLRDGLVGDLPTAPDTAPPAGVLYYLLKQLRGDDCVVLLDMIDHMGDHRVLRLVRELLGHCRRGNGMVVFLDHRDDLPPVVAADVVRFEIPLPDDDEIEKLVRDALRAGNVARPIRVDIKKKSFSAMLRNLRGLSRQDISRIIQETISDDQCFSESDFPTVLSHKRCAIQRAGLLESVEAPASLDEIGGLGRLKKWLKARENAFSKEAADFGLTPPRGILLLGVQGSGKSYCAKAIATAWQRPLIRLDPSTLYDRFVGESERRLRDALRQAERMAPIVLWIDEIEKGFASAASHSTDGGLSQRMFGSLLTWMQEHRAPVFIVATANDIEALPPELLRKGRFDEIFFVDLPAEEVRRNIFGIHLTKRRRDPAKFDLVELAKLSEGYSGAEIEQVVLSALHHAFSSGEELSTAMLTQAIQTSPSLSVTMRERVAALREWAAGRCVPAD